jgi:hypothetical protein
MSEEVDNLHQLFQRLDNLAAVDAAELDMLKYGNGYARRDSDGKLTHVPLEDVQLTPQPDAGHQEGG